MGTELEVSVFLIKLLCRLLLCWAVYIYQNYIFHTQLKSALMWDFLWHTSNDLLKTKCVEDK